MKLLKMRTKILILNTNRISGGAAIAAHRLYESLIGADEVEVHYLSIDDLYKGGFLRFVRKLLSFLDKLKFIRSSSRALLSSGFIGDYKVLRKIKEINPDIVHMHWINSGFISVKSLSKIDKPIIWSLHDMWPFTGGCHYNFPGCDKFHNGCKNCPLLDDNGSVTSKIYSNKINIYSQIKSLTFVGLSRWIYNESLNSGLAQYYSTINLPNTIDTSVYKKLPTEQSREFFKLKIGNSKRLIGFGAIGATSDPRKGFRFLKKALSNLNPEDYELLVFGGAIDTSLERMGFVTHQLGYIAGDEQLVNLYNSMDMLIVPSTQENLSNMILESLSCETPVVAFNIGGNSDLISHGTNGYLGDDLEPDSILKGINYISENESILNFHQVRKRFSYSAISKKYIKLYKELS
ncbi:glycosyltransferase [Vibrio parahaemolyticus]|uniref:glycosyltransferase n=1 Tax=Vibrio parahaemolyticus TaxID=670 RepID=UPI000A37E6C4|nr:glycosyltransferase [Vibrio parahaemolyticus]EGQ9466142.1 glycosyltransferase [Vibrio parahaemolyticus]EHP3974776.1 glycosyltransferase [Vibrio parahaemolyticus]EJB0383844.1 glycosyltransferase [Vibrio parahaemolyticus]EJG1102370.1 glycosyltransferase [Vibrio parahaemolyticus]EJG1627660.1 glycosyltransferase [Vibrio parahaemolyticus]